MKLETLATVRLPNQSARIMRQVLVELGRDWEAVAVAAGVSPQVFDDPHGELTGLEEMRLQRAFARVTASEPGIWFETGLRYHILALGPLGLATLSSPTTLHGLRTAMLFQDLCSSMLTYGLIFEDGEVQGMYADPVSAPQDLREFHLERGLGCVTRFLGDMWQDTGRIARVEVSLDRPRNWRRCEELLGFPVVFGAPQTKWIFNKGVGEMPLPLASPLLEESYQAMCEAVLSRTARADGVVAELTGLLIRSGREAPTAAQAARHLNVSERTLHRRLGRQALTFRQLVDQIREEHARYMLHATDLPIEQIAEAVGYVEAASFSRAFKRWTGTPPNAFRKARDDALEPVGVHRQ